MLTGYSCPGCSDPTHWADGDQRTYFAHYPRTEDRQCSMSHGGGGESAEHQAAKVLLASLLAARWSTSVEVSEDQHRTDLLATADDADVAVALEVQKSQMPQAQMNARHSSWSSRGRGIAWAWVCDEWPTLHHWLWRSWQKLMLELSGGSLAVINVKAMSCRIYCLEGGDIDVSADLSDPGYLELWPLQSGSWYFWPTGLADFPPRAKRRAKERQRVLAAKKSIGGILGSAAKDVALEVFGATNEAWRASEALDQRRASGQDCLAFGLHGQEWAPQGSVKRLLMEASADAYWSTCPDSDRLQMTVQVGGKYGSTRPLGPGDVRIDRQPKGVRLWPASEDDIPQILAAKIRADEVLESRRAEEIARWRAASEKRAASARIERQRREEQDRLAEEIESRERALIRRRHSAEARKAAEGLIDKCQRLGLRAELQPMHDQDGGAEVIVETDYDRVSVILQRSRIAITDIDAWTAERQVRGLKVSWLIVRPGLSAERCWLGGRLHGVEGYQPAPWQRWLEGNGDAAWFVDPDTGRYYLMRSEEINESYSWTDRRTGKRRSNSRVRSIARLIIEREGPHLAVRAEVRSPEPDAVTVVMEMPRARSQPQESNP